MPRVDNVLDDRIRRQGDYNSVIFAIPVGTTRYRMRMHRGLFPDAWPIRPGTGQNAVVAQVEVQVSQDAGANWLPWGEIGVHGGEWLGRSGIENFNTLTVWIPNEDNPDRRMRARLRIRRNNMRCRVDIDLDDTPRPPTTQLSGNSVGYTVSAIASSTGTSVTTSPSFTPTGTDRLMIAFSYVGTFVGPQNPTSMSSSVDGNMTQEFNFIHNIYFRNTGYAALNPTASSTTVTYTAAGSDDYNSCCAICFDGVLQTNLAAAIDAWTEQNGTGNNPSRAHSSETGDMCVQCLGADDNAIEVAGDAVSREEEENFGGDNVSMGVSTGVGAASVDMNWTAVGGAYGWGMATANINAGATGPPDLLTYLKHRTNVLLRM